MGQARKEIDAKWRGGQAMAEAGKDTAQRFWEQVGQKVDAGEIEQGSIITIEETLDGSVVNTRFIKVIAAWTGDDGLRRIGIADTVGPATTDIVLVVAV